MDVVGKVGVGCADAFGGSDDGVGGDGEVLTGVQVDGGAVVEFASADFWSLEVLHDREWSVVGACAGAEEGNMFGVFGVGSVGEVESGDVHASIKEAFDGFRCVAGWADGGNYFCAAHSFSLMGRCCFRIGKCRCVR